MNNQEIQSGNKGTLLIAAVLSIFVIVGLIIQFSDREASVAELELAQALCDQDSSVLSYDAQKYFIKCANGVTHSIEGIVKVSEILSTSPTLIEERTEVYVRLNRIIHQARTLVGCEPKDAHCEDKLKAKDAEVEARFKAQFGDRK